MHRSPLVAIFIVTLLALVAGCGGAADSRHPAGSPEALLDKFVRAVDSLDPQAIETCFDLSTDHGRRMVGLLAAAFRTIRGQREFEAAVRSKFGEAFARARFAAGDGPAALLHRVRDLRKRARIRVEGQVAKVDVVNAAGKPLGESPTTMARGARGWVFEVTRYLPDDPNLCEHLVHIMDAFRDRYVAGTGAVNGAETPEAFIEAMKAIDGGTDAAARESMVVVEPFLARYR